MNGNPWNVEIGNTSISAFFSWGNESKIFFYIFMVFFKKGVYKFIFLV